MEEITWGGGAGTGTQSLLKVKSENLASISVEPADDLEQLDGVTLEYPSLSASTATELPPPGISNPAS